MVQFNDIRISITASHLRQNVALYALVVSPQLRGAKLLLSREPGTTPSGRSGGVARTLP